MKPYVKFYTLITLLLLNTPVLADNDWQSLTWEVLTLTQQFLDGQLSKNTFAEKIALIEQKASKNMSQNQGYYVINVAENDTLSIRADAGIQSPKIGEIPHDARNIKIIGSAKKVKTSLGVAYWVPIKYDAIIGWVNRYFLGDMRTCQSPSKLR
jgi:hypothetical protein